MKKIFCALFLALVCFGHVWGGPSYYNYVYYKAKVTAQSIGEGSVYVSTSSTQGKTNTAEGQVSTPSNDPNGGSQMTFYLHAVPNQNYKFDGWSTSSTRPSSFELTKANGQEYSVATATNSIYTDKSTPSSSQGTENSKTNGSGSNTYTVYIKNYNIYGYFSEKATSFDVFIHGSSDGTITANGENVSGTKTINTGESSQITISLTATVSSADKVFFAWYTLDGEKKVYLSYDANWKATFEESKHVYAEFISTSLPIFQLGTRYFYNLNEAASAANGSGMIVAIKDGTVPAGDYTIPSGVTLLIPFDAANTCYTTQPGEYHGHWNPATPKNEPYNKGTGYNCDDMGDNSFVYRKLTLADGVNLTIDGSLSLSASRWIIYASGKSTSGSVTTYGYPNHSGNYRINQGYGMIDMQGNSTITVNGNLYCWGRIRGTGTITAKNKSTIYESFVFTDYRDPDYMGYYSKSTKCFPVNNYYIQDIQVPITYESGSTCTLRSAFFNVSDEPSSTGTMKLVGTAGSNNLIELPAGATFTKKYDVLRDRQIWELNNGAIFNNTTLSIPSKSLNSQTNTHIFTLTSNLDIFIKSGTTTISYDLALAAGATITIDKDATLALGSKASLYVYDWDDWGWFASGKKSIPLFLPSYERNNGTYDNVKTYTYNVIGHYCEDVNGGYKTATTKSYIGIRKYTDELDDATILVNGTLTVAGGTNAIFGSGTAGLYTTPHGANIYSEGAGQIIYSTGKGTQTETQSLNSVANYNTQVNDYNKNANSPGEPLAMAKPAITPAKLKNVDDSYTATSSATGETTFTSVHGRWFVGDAKNEKANHTYDFTYINGDANVTTDAIYWKDAAGDWHWNNVTTTDVSYANIWKGTDEAAGVNAYYCYTTYSQSSALQEGWIKLTQVGETSNFGGSDNNMYVYTNDKWQSIGTTDDECLYTIGEVRQALVGNTLVPVTKNTTPEDGAWHNTNDATKYYVDLSGTCVWKPATKVQGVEKAYVIEEQTYIRYNDGDGEDWMAVAYNAPYYYTADAQLNRTYYEYNATSGAWQVAAHRVAVSSEGTTAYYYYFADAIAAATAKKDPTIQLLADCEETSTTVFTLTSKEGSSEYTIDLNGHTIAIETSIAAPIKMNMTGGTYTITDNSADKNGALSVTGAMNARIYAIQLVAGTLNINGGTIAVNNTKEYNSGATATASSAIYVAAGQKVNMNSGTIDAKGCYYPRGIEVAGSTSAKAEININGGTINSESTQTSTAHGIYAVGGTINMKGGEINVLTKTTSATGIYLDASTNNYYAMLNMTGGAINATATTTTATGIFVNGTYTFNNTTPNTIKGTFRAVANISGGTITAQTGTTTAYAIQTYGTTNIMGGSVYATAGSTTASGILAYDGTTSISGNTNITVRGTGTCYGVYGCATTPADKTGRPYSPTITIEDGTFDVKTTTGTNAYGVYVIGGTREITNTTSGYYPGQYTSVAKAIINGGTFTVEACTSTGVGVYVSRSQIMTATTPNTVKFEALGIAEINGGTFNVSTTTGTTAEGIRSYGTTTVKGGTFNISPKTTDAYGIHLYGGKTTLSGSPEFNITATEKAYGITAGKEQPANSTGILYDAEVDVQGGVFNVNTTTNGTAYGVWLGASSRAITTGNNAGNYANAGTATISGGQFNVETKTVTAYGLYVANAVTESGATGYDPVTATPKATVTGGTFHAHAKTTTAYGACLNAGEATITGGTFEAEADGTNLTKAGNVDVRGINIGSNCVISKFSGVTVDAWANQVYYNSTYNNFGQYVYGIYIGANCAQTISNSTITARDAVNYTYGIRSFGTTTLDGNTITSQTKGGTTAYGLMADASTAGAQGNITMNSGTVNVTATGTALGVYTNCTPVTSKSAIGYSAAYFGTTTINGGIFNISTTTGTTAECVRSYGTTTINGGTFTATPKTTTAYGVRVMDGTTTVTGGTFNVTATTTTAYGVYANADVDANYGYTREAVANIQGGTFNVATKGGTTAYGLYVNGTKNASFHPKSVTGATSLMTEDRAVAATAVVTDGTFNVKASNNTSVFGIVVAATQTQGTATASPKCTINDGKFNINGATTSSAIVNNAAAAANFIISGGHYSATHNNLSKYVSAPYRVLECKHEEMKTTYPYEVSDMYTITFDSNGGSEVAPITQAYNTEVTAPADPTRDGYTFSSWSPGVPQTMPAENITCVAQWTANERTITFDSNGGSSVAAITLAPGTAITAPADPTREGYTFAGWIPAVLETMPEYNMTCVAQWKIVSQVDKEVEVTEDVESTQMVITTSGAVNVTEGSSLAVNNLYIQADAEKSGELFGEGDVDVDNAYMDYTFNGQAYNRAKQNWYAFAVPFEVDAEALQYKKANGDYADCGLGTAIDIIYYDGETRAIQGTKVNAWKYVEDLGDKTLKPGTLYLATFSKNEYAGTVRFPKKAASALISSNTVETEAHASQTGKTTDANWNGIANPTLYYSTLKADGVSVGQIYEWSDDDENNYKTVQLTEALSVGKPIFIQTAETTAVAIKADHPSAAPKRMLTNTDTKSELVDVRIAAEGSQKYSDRLFVAIDEDAKDMYTIGADVVKAGVAAKRAQMWVSNYNEKLCLNTVAPVDNVAEYALGISVPNAGAYVIDQASENEGMLYLTHNGEAIWNLSEMPYTLTLEAGTNTGYGLRFVKTIPGVVTNLSEAAANAKQGETQKLIRDNHLLIINNGRVYDAQGAELR